jgi:hypothetical protein
MNAEAQALIDKRDRKRAEAVNQLRAALPEINSPVIALHVAEFLAEYDELHARVRAEVFGVEGQAK